MERGFPRKVPHEEKVLHAEYTSLEEETPLEKKAPIEDRALHEKEALLKVKEEVGPKEKAGSKCSLSLMSIHDRLWSEIRKKLNNELGPLIFSQRTEEYTLEHL